MLMLKEMIENIINEKETDSKVNFHTYLNTKLGTIVESYKTVDSSKESSNGEEVL